MSASTHYDNASLGSPSTEHPIHRNTLHGHSKRVRCVAPLGNECEVSVSDDNSVIVWNFRTSEQEHRWDHKGAISVAVSHDGKYVVSGSRYGDLQLWDVESGDNFSGPWKLHEDKVWSVTCSPDGSRIASCSEDSTFIIWNARPDSPTGKPFLGPISTEQKAVHSIAYCPMGMKLATGGRDSTIKIWDAETGFLQVTLNDHTMSVSSVALTKDIVFSGSLDKAARVWDIGDSEQNAMKAVSKPIIPHPAAIKHIAVSEHFFATATYNCIYLGNLTTYELLPDTFEFPKDDEPNCIALSGDEGTMIVGTEMGKVYTWNIRGITSAPVSAGNFAMVFLRSCSLWQNKLKNNDHVRIQNFLGQDGDPRESHSLQSRSSPSWPVEETRRTTPEQIVIPGRFFGGLLCRFVAPEGYLQVSTAYLAWSLSPLIVLVMS